MEEYSESARQVFRLFNTLRTYWTENPGSLLRLGGAVVLFAVVYLISRLVRHKLLPWAQKRVDRRKNRLPGILLKGFSKPLPVLIWVLGLYAALFFLPLPDAWLDELLRWALRLLRIALIGLLAWGLIGSSDIAPMMVQNVQGKLDVEVDKTAAAFINKILKIVVICFAVVMVLGEMNFDVNGLLAGFGLAGLTVSLAAKESATNLFSGLILITEKPFSLGDWIQTGTVEGSVEDIGFRSTRVRTLDGSLVTVPNSQLCADNIVNATQRTLRMLRFTLGVTYDTPRTTIENLMEELRTMLSAREDVDSSTVRVRLTGFSASSIDILVQCAVKTPDLAVFLATQEQINLEILDIMQRQGAEFAFPSQTVYMKQE